MTEQRFNFISWIIGNLGRLIPDEQIGISLALYRPLLPAVVGCFTAYSRGSPENGQSTQSRVA
jgi:hypothetical protein